MIECSLLSLEIIKCVWRQALFFSPFNEKLARAGCFIPGSQPHTSRLHTWTKSDTIKSAPRSERSDGAYRAYGHMDERPSNLYILALRIRMGGMNSHTNISEDLGKGRSQGTSPQHTYTLLTFRKLHCFVTLQLNNEEGVFHQTSIYDFTFRKLYCFVTIHSNIGEVVVFHQISDFSS